MFDRFFAYRSATLEFSFATKKTIHILNKTSLSLVDVLADAKYPTYEFDTESIVYDWKVHLMAAKPPGDNRALKVHVMRTSTDQPDELTLMVCGNTYPFRTECTNGNYYYDDEVVEKQPGAIWYDRYENVKMEEAVGTLNEVYAHSAMKIIFLINIDEMPEEFIEQIRTSTNLLL